MNKTTVAVISAVGGGIVGGVVTYLTVNRALRTRYEDWANSEIDSVKARYAQINSESKSSWLTQTIHTPDEEEAIAVGKKLMAQLAYSTEDADGDETLSIFDQGVDPENLDAYDEDIRPGYERLEGEPYLIEEAEYFENEPEYELDTLTYYELDDTLTDERNAQIDRVDETIGARHLHMFPTNRNGEKTSVYIRNDEHETLYEVILVAQSYAAVVLGMDEVELGLKAPKQRPKKMKRDDD